MALILALPAFGQTVGKSAPETDDALEASSDEENEFSEEEIREMLFGADPLEEEAGSERPKTPAPVEAPKPSYWLPSFSAKLGLGYSDNPMYGPYLRNEAGYLEMESEVFVIREGNPNYLTYLYLFGDGKWFEGLPDYDLSGILLAQAEHTYVTEDSGHSFGLRLRHTYYDQAFDFSDLGLPYSMQIRSNKPEVIPHFSSRFSDAITGKLEFSSGWERFDDPSEDNEDRQVRASLAWQILEKLSLEAKASGRWVDYDERLRREADGNALADGKLETEKFGLALVTEIRTSSPWLESLELQIKLSQLGDNAGGYYDYGGLGFSLSHSAKWEKWLFGFELGWSQFRYDHRTVSSGERFERQGFTNELRVTRILSENWSAYLKWNREEDLSNSRDYEYFTNFFSMGISGQR
jgi:hypothetical protein